ncbi:unnamed protein product [Rotaria socialis]|uniref:Uncharacterized protein n=1 Tax=Rotaria socialis TaxID=392032 RepID=A0A821BL30_9BILA|nr:unnamed protein product [Rotaria socialis]
MDEKQFLIDKKSDSLNGSNETKHESSRLEWAESSWLRWGHLIYFSWIIPVIKSGYKRTLTIDDLDQLPTDDTALVLMQKFLSYDWKTTRVSIAIIKIFWKELTISGLLLLPYMFGRMAVPLIMRQIILLITDHQTSSSLRYVYPVIFLLCVIVSPCFLYQSTFRVTRIGLRIRHGLQSLIYMRLLSNKNLSLQQITSARMINLVGTDASQFLDCSTYFHFLWEAPMEFLIGFYLIYSIIGFLPAFRTLSEYHDNIAKCADKRIQVLSEMINAFHIVKMNNWEDLAEKRVDSMREQEFSTIRKASLIRALNMGLFFASMPLISLATIYGIWLTNGSFVSIDIFTAMSFYGVLRSPVTSFLPIAIEKTLQLRVAVKRIDQFLKESQQQTLEPAYTDQYQQSGKVTLQNACFSWNNNEIHLPPMNIDIESGSLVGIVGNVGSGKSSFFAAILGQMHLVDGEIFTNGSSFSYASQSLWIFVDTVRTNIILDKPFYKERYMNVLRACCLNADLESLGPTADLTMIGDKGINLSGGQRARISLARALYIDADIYLFDDPLASVDNKVAKQIYDQSIGPHGLLKNKTRLLITHQTKYLIDSDQILYFDHGLVRCELPSNAYQVELEKIPLIDEDTNIKPATANILDVEQSHIDHQSIIQDETSIKSTVNWSVWAYLFSQSVFGWFAFAFLIVLLLSGEILCEIANILLALLLNKLEMNASHTRPTPSIYLYVNLTNMVLSLVSAILFFRIILDGTNALEKKMVHALFNTSIRFYESNPSGRILSRASRDQQVVDEILPATLFDSVQSLLMSMGSIIVIGVINPWIFPVLIPLFGICVVLHHIYARSNHQVKHLESVARSPVYSLLASSLNGLMTIRALKNKDYFIKLFHNRIDANTRSYLALIGVSQWFGLYLDLLNNIFTVIATLLCLILKDQLNPALSVLLLSYTITIRAFLQRGIRQGVESQILMTSAERIYGYSQLPQEEDFGGEHGLIETSPDWPDLGTVEFCNYSFRYRSTRETALRDLCLRIEPNEKIGIIGRTGAGKSSLFQALFRFTDRSLITGHILIDGVDISRITLKHLRTHISIIPQQAFLFSGSLRSNLDPFNHYSDEQCWKALEDVQLKKFVSDHSERLLLPIAESGINLSAGQRQLVAAARAILKQSKILLIDEATANVDPATDTFIQQLIAHRFQDRTVLMIAHRLNTVIQSDRILVLKNGQLENLDVPQNILHDYQ